MSDPPQQKDDTSNALKTLGDPSGQQSSEYWNEWFNIVCKENHRSFEWYVDASEIARMLKHRIPPNDKETLPSTEDSPLMIHPGSGNSLVPVQLRDDFCFPHKHVVVDISEVALEEMQEVHDKHESEIQYIVGDVLKPPLPFESGTFDIWIDKGLLDALFKDAGSESSEQCSVLFNEAHRLLRSETGTVVVVSMAEDHSLKLILDNWLSCVKEDAPLCGWQHSLHVWELSPVSGSMRPFGFVMFKEKGSEAQQTSFETRFVSFHTMDDEVETITINADINRSWFTAVKDTLQRSREGFKCHDTTDVSSDPGHLLLATLEVKPWSTDDDLQRIGEIITTSCWTTTAMGGVNTRPLRPNWQAFEVVPVGFGISKLQLKCIMNAQEVDDLVEAISEWEGGGIIEDGIQSVDVDWSNTFPVGDTSSLLHARGKV